MDFTQLEYFRTVAKLGHFTKAAQELNVTQPSLSKAISRLESSLGVRLFDRQGKKIRLNAYGYALLRHVDQLFIELDDAQKELRDMQDAERGTVSMASYQLGRIQEPTYDFLTIHPNVRMYQYQMDIPLMKEKLENREIDFAVSISPIETINIKWEPLMTERFAALVPSGHRLAGRKTVRLEELKDERFIINNGSDDISRRIHFFCERAGFVPNVYFEGEQSALLDALVRSGLGVCLIPEDLYQYRDMQASAYTNEDEPVLITITGNDCTSTLGIATLKGRFLSASAQNFISFLQDYFKKRETP